MPSRYPSPHLPSRTRLPLLLACLALLGMATDAHAEAWAVTDSTHPLSVPPGVRLIQLDAGEHLDEQLSAGLPADPQQAMSLLRQRLQNPANARLGQDLVAAQQGLVDAWSVGVQKVPAVVVDRRYVVYGETDVLQALSRIDEYRRQEASP